MGWRTVEINTDEYVQLYLNNLLIKRINEKIIINLRDIELLIFNNDRATISIKLLNALAFANVSVVFMNASHEPSCYSVPVQGHHMSLKILEKQLNWKPVFKGAVWKDIIINKINSQKMFLIQKKLIGNKEIEEFNLLVSDVKHFDVSNREGHAAKIYWHYQYGTNFIRDQKAQTSPIINSMLNYGYAILRSLTIQAIIKKGLDSRISFFHKSFTNFFALASDIMEPFRPLVDEIVYNNSQSTVFSIEIRDQLIGISEKRISVNNVSYYLGSALDKVVDGIVDEKGWSWVGLWD